MKSEIERKRAKGSISRNLQFPNLYENEENQVVCIISKNVI